MNRLLLSRLLADRALRRALIASVIVATQAREGIATTTEQAERAYDVVSESNKPLTSRTGVTR